MQHILLKLITPIATSWVYHECLLPKITTSSYFVYDYNISFVSYNIYDIKPLQYIRRSFQYQSLGTILSHGYLLCSFLPTRIAFPALASILLGSAAKIPKNILIESFAESLSSVEASVIKKALTSTDREFSAEMKANLISILSRYGCRICPILHKLYIPNL